MNNAKVSFMLKYAETEAQTIILDIVLSRLVTVQSLKEYLDDEEFNYILRKLWNLFEFFHQILPEEFKKKIFELLSGCSDSGNENMDLFMLSLVNNFPDIFNGNEMIRYFPNFILESNLVLNNYNSQGYSDLDCILLRYVSKGKLPFVATF